MDSILVEKLFEHIQSTGCEKLFVNILKPICEPWCWNMHTNICHKIAQFCSCAYTSTMVRIWETIPSYIYIYIYGLT